MQTELAVVVDVEVPVELAVAVLERFDARRQLPWLGLGLGGLPADVAVELTALVGQVADGDLVLLQRGLEQLAGALLDALRTAGSCNSA